MSRQQAEGLTNNLPYAILYHKLVALRNVVEFLSGT